MTYFSNSIDAHGNVVVTGADPSSPVQVVVNKKEMNLEQQAALEKYVPLVFQIHFEIFTYGAIHK